MALGEQPTGLISREFLRKIDITGDLLCKHRGCELLLPLIPTSWVAARLLTNILCPNILKTVMLWDEQTAALCQMPCLNAILEATKQVWTNYLSHNTEKLETIESDG